MMQKKAIVVGASMAGLLAARVLSDHFEEVVLIERDSNREHNAVRKGTPQASHIHLLLVKGREILQEFFPNIEEDLAKRGAKKIDFLDDGRYLLPSGWAQKFHSGIATFACTRTLLEEAVFNQVIKIPNVKILEDISISSLVLEGASRAGLKTSDGKRISGDLIVDCTGRNTKTPEWLSDLGFPKPRDTRVDSFVGYATRRYIPPKGSREWKMLVILNKPTSNPRAGIIFPIEGGKWLVGLYGIGKNYPPSDEQGFLEFAGRLESSELHDALKEAIPDSKIQGYRVQGSRKFHYEDMTRWPENFLVMGDAVSVFNPFYGQGMTSAALGARVLDGMLKKSKGITDGGFSSRFQKQLAKAMQLPWVLGTSEDMRWPTTVGKRPNAMTRMVQDHAQRVLLLGPKSKLATKSFLEMMHMTRSPLAIFHPTILFQLAMEKIWKEKE